MRCPSCGVSFSTPPAECPNCKLTLEKLDRKFGLVPYCSRYLSDRSETLPTADIDDLRALLKPFEQKFPQIVFSVVVINLGEDVSISEYAFWLVNRARISSVNATGPKNFDLFLVVDPKGRAAAMRRRVPAGEIYQRTGSSRGFSRIPRGRSCPRHSCGHRVYDGPAPGNCARD